MPLTGGAIQGSSSTTRRPLAISSFTCGSAEADADSYILRGAVNVELRKYQAAKLDFQRYLTLLPEARDRQRVEDQIAALDRYLMRAGGE